MLQKGNRNTLRTFTVGDTELVVKRFGVPHPLNRVVYSFFRKPKGLRAYNHALIVASAGFETPAPVAYAEYRSLGLIADSYFISLRCPYGRRFYEFGDAAIDDCRDVVQAFAHYAAALHEAGIFHKDFSPGNILFDKIDGEYHFSIVDINRMRFGKVSVAAGCRNFVRLWGQPEFFDALATEYAIARNADVAYCIAMVRKARTAFWKRYSMRHKVKFTLKF